MMLNESWKRNFLAPLWISDTNLSVRKSIDHPPLVMHPLLLRFKNYLITKIIVFTFILQRLKQMEEIFRILNYTWNTTCVVHMYPNRYFTPTNKLTISIFAIGNLELVRWIGVCYVDYYLVNCTYRCILSTVR